MSIFLLAAGAAAVATEEAAYTPSDDSALAWYDPSDTSTIWEWPDATGANGVPDQVVRRIDDKSGNGYHLIATNEDARYRTAGGLHWLELQSNCVLSVATTTPVRAGLSMIHAIEVPSGAGAALFRMWFLNGDTFYAAVQQSTETLYVGTFGPNVTPTSRGLVNATSSAGAVPTDTPTLLEAYFDVGTQSGHFDGSQVATDSNDWDGDDEGNDADLQIGDGGSGYAVDWYGGAFLSEILGNMTSLRAFYNERAGL